MNILMACFNISEAYARHGLGSEFLPEIGQAQRAIESMVERAVKHQRYGCTGPEMNAIATALAVHDEQLDNSTVRQMERMVAYVDEEIASGRAIAMKLP